MPYYADDFPKLKLHGYRDTSEPSLDYNCLAWATGISDKWMDPSPGYWWPSGVARGYELNFLCDAYASLGWTRCENAEPENQYEKIAIYAVGGDFDHAARMLDSGSWTSKLDDGEDIEHARLDSLSGPRAGPRPTYGEVVAYMKRPRK